MSGSDASREDFMSLLLRFCIIAGIGLWRATHNSMPHGGDLCDVITALGMGGRLML